MLSEPLTLSAECGHDVDICFIDMNDVLLELDSGNWKQTSPSINTWHTKTFKPDVEF